jgi:hypothetical protein
MARRLLPPLVTPLSLVDVVGAPETDEPPVVRVFRPSALPHPVLGFAVPSLPAPPSIPVAVLPPAAVPPLPALPPVPAPPAPPPEPLDPPDDVFPPVAVDPPDPVTPPVEDWPPEPLPPVAVLPPDAEDPPVPDRPPELVVPPDELDLPPEPLPPDPPESLDEHAAAVTTSVATRSRCVTMKASTRGFTDRYHVAVVVSGKSSLEFWHGGGVNGGDRMVKGVRKTAR